MGITNFIEYIWITPGHISNNNVRLADLIKP